MWAERIAFGELGLTPAEFYKISPFEFYIMRDAKLAAQDKWWSKASFLTSVVIRDVMATKGRLKMKEIQDALVSEESLVREQLEKRRAFEKAFQKGGN